MPRRVEHADFGWQLHNPAANLPRRVARPMHHRLPAGQPIDYVPSDHGRDDETFEVTGLAASP